MAIRWRVALLVCVAIAISYLDRQSLPVAVAAIQLEIPLTNTQFGALNSVFLFAYALAYAGGGVLVPVENPVLIECVEVGAASSLG